MTMNLVIPLTHDEETRLSVAARKIGVAPSELIKRLALEHLPALPLSAEDKIDAVLREWQAQDGKDLLPDVSMANLFAQWAEEDAQMTDEEREAEDRLWQEIERSIDENRVSFGIG